MIPYADTNFFTNRLLNLTHNAAADLLAESHEMYRYPPLPVTWLLRLELTNALQRVVFESRHGSQHFRATPESVMIADILHVASALLLGCDTFWSFDVKALKLAKLEGLKTN